MVFTIILRGPLHDHSLQNVRKYLEKHNVMISYWDGTGSNYKAKAWHTVAPSKELINKAKGLGVPLIVNSYNNLPPVSRYLKEHLIGASINVLKYYCTYHALANVHTPYFIAMRSDSSYPDLEVMIDKILRNPTKLVCGSINTQSTDMRLYTVGEHIVGGPTGLGLKAFMDCIKVFYKSDEKVQQRFQPLLDLMPPGELISAEQLFATSVVMANGDPIQKEASSVMRRNFEIVDIYDLGDVIWTGGWIYRGLEKRAWMTQENKHVLQDILDKYPQYKFITSAQDF